MATINLVGNVQNSAESLTGWNTGNLDTELFYQGSGSVGAKVGSGTSGFVHTGTVRNFSSGGANEGDHIIVILTSLTAGKLDTKANGGLRIRCGSSTTIYGDWYVDGSDTKSPTTSFLPYIANPASDFDAVAGGLTTTGNPAQLNTADVFGGVFSATSGIMGNFNNSLVDQITIGKGLEMTGTAGVMSDFVTADEGTSSNRYGWITTKDGVIYCQGKLYFGNSSTSTVFLDTDQVLIFQDAPVATDFYEVVIDNASSDVTFDGFVIKSAGASQFTFSYIAGTCLIKNGTIDSARQLDLGSGVTIENQKISNSGVINSNGATLDVVNITGSTAVSALVIDSLSEMNLITNASFDNNSGHSIELTATGTYTFLNITFTGGGSDETTTADVYNNSGGAVTILVAGGGDGAFTIRNSSGSTTTISASTQITLSGLPTGVEVRIFDDIGTAGNPIAGTEISGIESTTGDTYTFGDDAGNDVIIVIFDEDFDPVYLQYTIPSLDATIPFTLINSRNYLNP